MLRVSAGVSGKGSTALYLMDDMLTGSLHGKICMPLVVASSYTCEAYSIFREQHPDAKVVVVDPRDYEDDQAYADALTHQFRMHGIDVYGQYGLIVKTPVAHLPEDLIKINQHPTRKYFGGLGFWGLVPHLATLLYFQYLSLEYAYSECICHEALEEYDTGKVIMRQRVLLESTMTPEQAQRRTLDHEWQCQASALLRIYNEGWPLDEYPDLLEPLDLHWADLAKEDALELCRK